MLLRLRDLNAIVIAGINGNTAGGGCEFSLGCDLRVMSDGPYKIGLPETSVGILPGGGGTQRLSRLIGSSRALDLILHARLINPKEAHDLGIINKLLPKDNFLEELRFYCEDLANRAPIALNQVKKIIHQGLDMSLEESLMLEQKAFDVTMNSQDAARAMRSLLNTEENIEDASKFEWKGE
jgi:enoyl-CoA hydratase